MLEHFLNLKPLYYNEIDYTRMPRVYERIKKDLKIPKIIHIIGTNGKGTTGRFLATALYNITKSVGHYTSPHIIDFNERIWLNGSNVTNEVLELAHLKLLNILTKDEAKSLSYFEYTTFLAMVVFEGLEYIVLEAGLGGEHDATAVFKKELTLVTPIDKDHEDFLGTTIKEIATTKLNAIQDNAILAHQNYQEVYEIAFAKKQNILKIEDILNAKDIEKVNKIAKEFSLVTYLRDNLALSISALKFLNLTYEQKHFENAKLFGRLTQINEQIIVDVGHNTLAANAILKALNGKKFILVYNSYKDKEYSKILSILKPIIKEVQIIDIEDERIEKSEKMKKTLENLDIKYSQFNGIKEDEKYLVFGSFKVVENFLKVQNG